MPVSDAIKAIQLAHGEGLTSQQIADFAKAAWDDWRRALNAGRHVEAAEHLAEFDELCALFQNAA